MVWFNWNFFIRWWMSVLALLLFNEYLIYYLKLFSCKWPLVKAKKNFAEEPLR